ncbi:hypothetical protein Acr_17g0001160 [Actinidia rufa]|uniref:Uncharacterized protein n=1 Tax=Actinidia rufa TaxID=165716 RepID=A0A7J0G189_9ERIC|nr:hypothetical protein Acr_17g0001160 [Actinidia rufa]
MEEGKRRRKERRTVVAVDKNEESMSEACFSFEVARFRIRYLKGFFISAAEYHFGADAIASRDKYGRDLASSVMRRAEAVYRDFNTNINVEKIVGAVDAKTCDMHSSRKTWVRHPHHYGKPQGPRLWFLQESRHSSCFRNKLSTVIYPFCLISEVQIQLISAPLRVHISTEPHIISEIHFVLWAISKWRPSSRFTEASVLSMSQSQPLRSCSKSPASWRHWRKKTRQTSRIPPMRIDEHLSAGKVYLLLPASRAPREALESEMAFIESTCEKRHKRTQRRSSKVLPMVTEGSGFKVERPLAAVAGYGTGFPDHRLGSYRSYS